MHPPPRSPVVRTLIAAAAASPAWLVGQQITWAEPAAGSLRVLTVAEANPAGAPTVLLDGVDFVVPEITGRTAQQELDATRSRRVERLGVVRVELPDGGRLLAYHRPAAGQWGFLWIDSQGRGTSLLELPGAATSPFTPELAVAADGLHAVFPTLAGEFWIARLDGGTFPSTGRPVRRVTNPGLLEGASTMAGREVFFWVTDDDRLWRCAFADGGLPEDVSPPRIAGARMKDELALSGDGRFAVSLYGPRNPDRFGIYLTSATGATRQLPPTPTKYEEPGYLPLVQGGPRLLLNHDGSRLLYVDASLRDEIYLLDVATGQSMHVTGDPIFQPYIGILIIPAFAGQVAVFGMGDVGRDFDFYAATTATPNTVFNLTQTAGNTQQPWGPGGLVVHNVAISSRGDLLLHEADPTGPTRLRRIDAASGASAILADPLRAAPRLGAGHGGRPDVLVPRLGGGDGLVETTFGLPIVAGFAGVELDDPLALGGVLRGMTARVGSVEAVVLHDPLRGLWLALPAASGVSQRAFATAAGNLLLQGSTLVHVSTAGAATLQATGVGAIPLSGR